MLWQTAQGHSSLDNRHPFISGRRQWKSALAHFAMSETCRDALLKQSASSPEDAPGPEEGDAPLEDAARSEREYVRQRLREELQRDPSEEEVDEWLRQHTEGY